MKTAPILILAGLAASAQAQSAQIILTATQTVVTAGDTFTITATAFGDMDVFSYNLLLDVTQGAEMVSHVSNLVANPTGSSSFFGAPAGDGLGVGSSGLGVDIRDASAGVIISPLPLDGLPLFSFQVHIANNAPWGILTYQAYTGSGSFAALQYPDTSVSPIVFGQNYTDIDFGSVSVAYIPAPSGLACLGLASLCVSTRRRARSA